METNTIKFKINYFKTNNFFSLTIVFKPIVDESLIPKRDVFLAIECMLSLETLPERLVSACLRYLKTAIQNKVLREGYTKY